MPKEIAEFAIDQPVKYDVKVCLFSFQFIFLIANCN